MQLYDIIQETIGHSLRPLADGHAVWVALKLIQTNDVMV